jgi:hypothetical protein
MSVAGRKRAAYLNTGTYSSPTWTEMKRITDVSRPQSKSTGDRMYRGAKSKKKVPGIIEYGFSFKYQVKNPKYADTVLAALQDSFDNDTVLDVAFLSRPIVMPTGTYESGGKAKGVRGPLVVTKFDLNEADEEGISYDVELSEVDEEQSGSPWEIAAYEVAITAAA